MAYTGADIVEKIRHALQTYARDVAKKNGRVNTPSIVEDSIRIDEAEGIVYVTIDTEPGIDDYAALVISMKTALGPCMFTLSDDSYAMEDTQRKVCSIWMPRSPIAPIAATPCRIPVPVKSGGCCRLMCCMVFFAIVCSIIAAALCVYVALWGTPTISLSTIIQPTTHLPKVDT